MKCAECRVGSLSIPRWMRSYISDASGRNKAGCRRERENDYRERVKNRNTAQARRGRADSGSQQVENLPTAASGQLPSIRAGKIFRVPRAALRSGSRRIPQAEKFGAPPKTATAPGAQSPEPSRKENPMCVQQIIIPDRSSLENSHPFDPSPRAISISACIVSQPMRDSPSRTRSNGSTR